MRCRFVVFASFFFLFLVVVGRFGRLRFLLNIVAVVSLLSFIPTKFVFVLR